MPKMLILRGNSDNEGKTYPDEQGNLIAWPKGALHEKAAKDYATLKGYDGDVLDVSGDPGKGGDRDNNPQTAQAVKRLRDDPSYAAIYGFSGGGYDVLHILKQLTVEELKRIKLVVVLGAPPNDKGYPSESDFSSESIVRFKKFASRGNPDTDGIEWELVYLTNPPPDDPVVRKGKDGKLRPHMFGPERLLALERFTQRVLRKHPSLLGGPGPWLKPPGKP
jgi:hypothetical protein